MATLRTRWMDTMDLSMKSRPIFRVDTPTPHATIPTKPKVDQDGGDGRPGPHVLVYTCSVRQRNERTENS
jgi:hypothetical protein